MGVCCASAYIKVLTQCADMMNSIAPARRRLALPRVPPSLSVKQAGRALARQRGKAWHRLQLRWQRRRKMRGFGAAPTRGVGAGGAWTAGGRGLAGRLHLRLQNRPPQRAAAVCCANGKRTATRGLHVRRTQGRGRRGMLWPFGAYLFRAGCGSCGVFAGSRAARMKCPAARRRPGPALRGAQ